MRIEAVAPNRIDLAGGSTDLHPLYLFMDGGCTVNLAVSVRSHAVVHAKAQETFEIVSHDLHESFEGDERDLQLYSGRLCLVTKTVSAFRPSGGMMIETRNETPAGSGLGASSSLIVALVGALSRACEKVESHHDMVTLATNIETSVLGIPAGSQDHVAALFGGLSVMDFHARGFSRTPVPLTPEETSYLEETIILSYTGESRFSGMNNWDIIKAYIDNTGDIREKLIHIRDLARELAEALAQKRFDRLFPLVGREWNLRKALAPGVTNKTVDSIMAAATASGALANKICGAGGGGCMITLVETSRRKAVEEAIHHAGGRVMPFTIDPIGLEVRTAQL